MHISRVGYAIDMLLLEMGASRMTLADFEKAAASFVLDRGPVGFTVGSIASWKTGAPATERQKKTVSHALRALGRQGLVRGWKIPRWPYLHELVHVRRALGNQGLVAVPVPGKSLVVYALTPDDERVAQEILRVRRLGKGTSYVSATTA